MYESGFQKNIGIALPSCLVLPYSRLFNPWLNSFFTIEHTGF